MKSPPSKKKTTGATTKKLGINDRLSLDEATKLIAARTTEENDTNRTAEDRARKRITRDAKNGKLHRESNQTFILGYLVDWARTIWPDKFNDLPFWYLGLVVADGLQFFPQGRVRAPYVCYGRHPIIQQVSDFVCRYLKVTGALDAHLLKIGAECPNAPD